MNKIQRISWLLYSCIFLLACQNGSEKKPSGIKHVFVIGIDAMSSQGLEKAVTPNMDYLIANGAVCRSVRTVLPSSSSSNWASMLAGAGIEVHGITSNDWEPDNYALKPVGITKYGMFPTVVNVVRKQLPNNKIGMIYQWDGFGRLFEKDVATFDKSYETEIKTAQALADYIRAEKPTFTFTQLDDVDHYGHEYGHMTDKYLEGISNADKCVGMILQAVKEAGIEKESLIMVVADHGGIGYGHGGQAWEEVTVPFILCGKGIKKGFEIQQQTYMFDVAPTIVFALGLEAPYAWTGRPIRSAFEGFETKPDPVLLKKLSYGPLINGGRHLFEQAGGLFVDQDAEVVIEPYQTGDKVYYTTDGSEPTQKSALYEVPFKLNKTTVIKAKSYSKTGSESLVSDAYFRLLNRNPANGINVSFYQGKDWSDLPVFRNEKVVSQWIADEIQADIDQINKLLLPGRPTFGLVYTTSLQIDKAGKYNFYLQSDDGSKLYVDGQIVVNNDGGHGVIEKEGSIELTEGRHALTVEFFNNGGGFWIDAFYKGPGIPKQIIPADKLFRKP